MKMTRIMLFPCKWGLNLESHSQKVDIIEILLFKISSSQSVCSLYFLKSGHLHGVGIRSATSQIGLF